MAVRWSAHRRVRLDWSPPLRCCFPERELTLLLFFVIPIRLTAKKLLIFSAVLALFGFVFPIDHVANAAHLGGMAAGIVFVRQFIQGRWPEWKFSLRRTTPRKLVATHAGKGNFWQIGGEIRRRFVPR